MSLIVNSLSKCYGNAWALRDVSFEVAGGSVIGLFGASGSGKTTLLRSIAGQLKTSGGTLSLDGADLTAVKAKERPVTYVGGQKAKVTDLLPFFDTGSSTGEERIERFESAVAEAAKVILLDDPFQHVDRDLRAEGFAALRRLGKMRGKVIIFASSDFQQILQVADEVAFLSGGEIVQTGTPQQIYDEPDSAAAASLTGENNLIDARRLSSSDSEIPEFHTIAGGHRIFAENADKAGLGPINQNLTLAIRPEQILVTEGTSYAEDNLLKASVKKIRHLGPTTLVEFDAGGLTLKVWFLKFPGYRIGDTCMLGLPPHRIRILKN